MKNKIPYVDFGLHCKYQSNQVCTWKLVLMFKPVKLALLWKQNKAKSLKYVKTWTFGILQWHMTKLHQIEHNAAYWNVTNTKQTQLALTLKVLVLGDGEEGGESDKDFLEREERSLLRE